MSDRISLSGNFMEATPAFARRPIKARNSRWATASAALLARQGVTPNAISCASVLFAGAAGLAFVMLRFAGTPLAQAALLCLATKSLRRSIGPMLLWR